MELKYILPDTPEGKALGFTSNKFTGVLIESGDKIIIAFLYSFSAGNADIKGLIKEIKSKGFLVEIITSLPRMEAIGRRLGFDGIENYSQDNNINYKSLRPKL